MLVCTLFTSSMLTSQHFTFRWTYIMRVLVRLHCSAISVKCPLLLLSLTLGTHYSMKRSLVTYYMYSVTVSVGHVGFPVFPLHSHDGRRIYIDTYYKYDVRVSVGHVAGFPVTLHEERRMYIVTYYTDVQHEGQCCPCCRFSQARM